MVSKIKTITEIELEQKLERLRNLISNENHTRQEVKDLMKEIVPTYIDVDKDGQPGQKQKEKSQNKRPNNIIAHKKKKRA